MKPIRLAAWIPGLAILAAAAAHGAGIQDPDLARRLGDAVYALQRIGAQEAYGPRPLDERVPLLEALAREAPAEQAIAEELARARLARGDEAGARAAYQVWVAAHPEPATAMARQAEFLVSRRAIPEALAVLEDLAARRTGRERAAVYGRALELVERFRPAGVMALALHRKRVQAAPDEVTNVLALLRAVRAAEGVEAAVAELDRLVPDPSDDPRWIDERTDLLLEAGREAAARAFLEGLVTRRGRQQDSVRLAQLLRRQEVFDETVTELIEEAAAPPMDPARAELLVRWLAENPELRSSHEAPGPEGLLRGMEEAWKGHLDAARLGRLAELWQLHLHGAEAIRLRLRAVLAAEAAGDPAGAAAARRALIESLLALDDPGETLGQAGAVVQRVYQLDPHPGVVSGAASLFLAGAEAARSVRGLGASLGADGAVARLDAWVAAAYRQDPGAPAWEPVIRSLVARYERQEEPLRGADLLLRYAADHADSRQAARLRLDACEVVGRLGGEQLATRRPQLEAWARRVLEAATRAGWEDLRRRAFSMLEASLRAREARDQVLALYRGELDGGAGAETFEAFLSLLASYGLHQEAEQVYDRALASFGGRDWYSKAARWYLRQRRQGELDRLGRRAVVALGSDELTGYLQEFTSYAGRGKERDARLYLELHRAALDLWPHQLSFARALARYHAHFHEDEALARLRVRYGVRDPELWRQELRARMATGGLGGTLRALEAEPPENTAARTYLAEALEWLSRFEEAQPHWLAVSRLVPDQVRLAEAAARSLRSLGRPLEAEPLLLGLARLEPFETRWTTLVGEVRMEGGDLAGARRTWRDLPALRPGDAALYKEGATILWDYYLYDDAVAEFDEARRVLGLPHLFAKELSAVHESRRDLPAALAQAAVHLVYQDPWDSVVSGRVVGLARQGHAGAARAAFAAVLAADPGNVPALEVFARLLGEMGATWAEQRAVLVGTLGRRPPAGVASWVRRRARDQGDVELEGLALERLVEARGRATATLFDRARFLLRTGDRAASRALEAELRTRAVGASSGQREQARRIRRFLGDLLFDWGERQTATAEYRAAVARAVGSRQQDERRHLARRLLEGGDVAGARAELEALVEADPTRRQWVLELADLAVSRRHVASLEAVYETAVERLGKAAGISPEGASAARRELRRRWAADLVKLGATTRLAPVLVALVRAEPDEAWLADEATRLARAEGVLEAFQAPFLRWAAESPKDFRAHRLLAWIASAAGRLEEAVEHLAHALREEPQRGALRVQRAALLGRLRRYDDALAEYRTLRKLEPAGSTSFVDELARLERLAGRPAEARTWVEALRPAGLGSELDAGRMEAYAGALAEQGAYDEAAEVLLQLFRSLEDPGALLWSPSYGVPERLARWLVRSRGPAAAMRTLDQQAERLAAAPGASAARARARERAAQWLRGHARDTVIQLARDLGPAAERRQLEPLVAGIDVRERWNPASFWKDSGFEELYLAFLEDPVVRGQPARERYRDDLWEHLERTGRTAPLIQALEQAGGVGKPWERARALRRLAEVHRRQGQEPEELRALQRVPGEGPSWYLEEGERRRLMDLVLSLEGRKGLGRELARRGLWGLNEALRRELPELALELLDEHFGPGQGPPGPQIGWTQVPERWRLEARTRVAEAFPRAGTAIDPIYQQLLDLRPLAAQVGAPADPEVSWTRSPWYPAAQRYARDLLRRGRRDRARAFARALLEGAPRDAQAGLEVAGLLHDLGDEGPARQTLEAALARAPGDTRIQEGAAERLFAWGEKDRALALVRGWVVDQDPGSQRWDQFARVMGGLGLGAEVAERLGALLAGAAADVPLHRLGGLLDQAERAAGSAGAAALHSRLLGAWKLQGPRLEFLARRPEVAVALRVRAFEGAVAASAQAPRTVRVDLQRRLAELHALRGDGAAARRDLEAVGALEADAATVGETLPDWTLGRLRVLDRIGETAQADSLLRAYAGLTPGSAGFPERVSEVHRLLLELGHPERAAALRQQVLAERYRLGGQGNREVLAGRFREAVTAGDLPTARRWLDELLRLDPHAADSLELGASQLEAAGDRAGAAALRRRQLALVPAPEVKVRLGSDLMAAPETLDEGLRLLAEAVQDRAADERALDAAMAALRQRAPDAAAMARAWTPAFAEPGGAEFAEGMGMAALGRGDSDEAVRQLTQAARLQVRRVGAAHTLVDLLERSGRHPEAEVWRTALRARESVRPGGPSRWLRQRVFRAAATGKRWHQALEWVDLPDWLRDLFRGERPSTPAARALERILGEPLSSGDEGGHGYTDVEPEGDGEAPPGGLLDGGGDRGVQHHPFARPSAALEPRERLQDWAEGLDPGQLLELLAAARQGAGDLDGALEVVQVGEWLGFAGGAPEARRQLEGARAEAALRSERRLVLASDD